MKNTYRRDVAMFLARLAAEGKKITYGELSKHFEVNHRRWGDILGGIAIRCHEAGLPLLAVIVVAKDSEVPSVDALLYQDLGCKSEQDVKEEQQRCFAFDWSASPLR
jgi:hypothetical protein